METSNVVESLLRLSPFVFVMFCPLWIWKFGVIDSDVILLQDRHDVEIGLNMSQDSIPFY